MENKEFIPSVPASLAPFFQEYNLEQLDLVRSRFTIIERVLQFGNRQEIRWLSTVYPKAEIKDWVIRWGDEALPEPHLLGASAERCLK